MKKVGSSDFFGSEVLLGVTIYSIDKLEVLDVVNCGNFHFVMTSFHLADSFFISNLNCQRFLDIKMLGFLLSTVFN